MQAIVCGIFWCYIMTMLPNQGGGLDWKELQTLSSASSPPTRRIPSRIPSLDAHDSSQECQGRDRKWSLLSCVRHSHFCNWTEYTQDEWVCKCDLQGFLKGGEWVYDFRRSGASRGDLSSHRFPSHSGASRIVKLYSYSLYQFLHTCGHWTFALD